MGVADLNRFVVPIRTLIEPGVAAEALRALDAKVEGATGTKLGLLYYDMVDESIADVEGRYGAEMARIEKQRKDVASVPAFPSTPEKPVGVERLMLSPAKKQKTRPAEAAGYEIVQPAEVIPATTSSEDLAAPSPQTFDVSRSTAEVFATFFDRSESRGAVAWTAFEGAMAELGFSVMPRYGSVYTFFPPKKGVMGVEAGVKGRPFTVHRPHGAWIEGCRVLVIGRRLGRVYGWARGTFRVKKGRKGRKGRK